MKWLHCLMSVPALFTILLNLLFSLSDNMIKAFSDNSLNFSRIVFFSATVISREIESITSFLLRSAFVPDPCE